MFDGNSYIILVHCSKIRNIFNQNRRHFSELKQLSKLKVKKELKGLPEIYSDINIHEFVNM